MKQELPSGWSVAKISDISLFVTSGSRGWGKYYSSEGPRFIRVGDFCRNEIALNLERMARVQPPSGAEGRRTSVKTDDVMLTITADVGMAAAAQENLGEAYVNQHVALIRLEPGLNGRAFAYGLLDPVGLQRLVRASQYGATKPGLSLVQVRNFEVKIPPLPEQARIVEALDSYLSRLDAAEEGLKRVQANLKRYRASVLKAAVEGRLVPTEAELARQESRDYEPASVLLERILKERRRRWEEAELAKMEAKGKVPKNDKWKAKYEEPVVANEGELPSLPDGWCWARMEALAEYDRRAIGAGPFGTIFKARDFRPEGVTIIFLRHVKPGRYLKRRPTYMDREKWNELFRPYSVSGGELLVTKLGDPPGDAAIFPIGSEPAMVTPDVMKMRVNETIAVPRYLMHFINSDPARKYAFGAAFGTTRLRLTLPIFRNIPVPVPPLAEQVRIVEYVEELFSVADEVETSASFERRRSKRLQQAILKWAFEGKLVDQDPKDEPASELLERIRQEPETAAQAGKKARRRTRLTTT